MRSKLILALFLFLGLLFPMLPKQGGRAAAAARDNPTWEQLEYITSQTLDVALDEFYYSAGGHSGRHSEI